MSVDEVNFETIFFIIGIHNFYRYLFDWTHIIPTSFLLNHFVESNSHYAHLILSTLLTVVSISISVFGTPASYKNAKIALKPKIHLQKQVFIFYLFFDLKKIYLFLQQRF